MNSTQNTVPIAEDDENPFVSYAVGSTPEDTFVIPFQFWVNEDLTVQFEGVDQIGWNTTGAGDPTGGSLVLGTPVSDGTLTIQRYVPEERYTVFPIAGPFRIEALNDEFDHLLAIVTDRRFTSTSFDEVWPIDSVYTTMVNSPPSLGDWTMVETGTIGGQTSYMWRRTA